MPKQFLTLSDVHAQNRSVGPLIEDNLDRAPVWGRVPVTRSRGLTYEQAVRTKYPSGEFTHVGEGALLTAAEYDLLEFRCKHVEAQLEVLESIVKARHRNTGAAVEDVLELEAGGYIRQEMRDIDSQFFFGAASIHRGAAKGFPGLIDMVATSNTLGAGATTGTTHTSAWFVFENADEGVSFLMPEGEELNLSPWQFGQVQLSGSVDGGDIRKTNAYTSGLTGYIGLKAVRPERCIWRVCNINKTNARLTDEIAALIRALAPSGYTPTACYANPMVGFWLSGTRAPTTIEGAPVASTYAGDLPASVGGIPLVYTDSLKLNESEVLGANARLTALI
jgi:hypothetical protein